MENHANSGNFMLTGFEDYFICLAEGQYCSH